MGVLTIIILLGVILYQDPGNWQTKKKKKRKRKRKPMISDVGFFAEKKDLKYQT